MTLLLTLILVALVIERAVEVYVSKRYDPEKLTLRRPLARAETKLVKAERALAEERERRHGSSRSPSPEDQQYMDQLVKDVQDAHTAVDEADERTWRPLSKLPVSHLRCLGLLVWSSCPWSIPSDARREGHWCAG